jgi:hypothetical protein
MEAEVFGPKNTKQSFEARIPSLCESHCVTYKAYVYKIYTST